MTFGASRIGPAPCTFVAAGALVFALTASYAIWSTTALGAREPSSDGPALPKVDPNKHEKGDNSDGKKVFWMETFGNEGFWTDAVRLPEGVLAKKFTPVDALKAGYNVNVDALGAATQKIVAAELKTDLSAAQAPHLKTLPPPSRWSTPTPSSVWSPWTPTVTARSTS